MSFTGQMSSTGEITQPTVSKHWRKLIQQTPALAVWKSDVRSENPKLYKFKKLSLKKWSTWKFDKQH